MKRLLIHVEGQTEEDFVNEVLGDYLMQKGYEQVSARIVGNARQRNKRGGIRSWPAVKKEIVNHLREDANCVATTMVDYYALPQEGAGAWPGRNQMQSRSAKLKAEAVESALLADVVAEIGHSFNPLRFVPFVLVHEFEGLLFSDCFSFSDAIGRQHLASHFQAIRNQFQTPEEINDSPLTAPSKRILTLVPDYQKPLFGSLAALQIGLDKIRRECPNFDFWLSRLELSCK